jgi:hypothetical protein
MRVRFENLGPNDVAKLLGGTVDTIEKLYAPFIGELANRQGVLSKALNGLSCRAHRRRPTKEEYSKNNAVSCARHRNCDSAILL